MSDVLEGDRLEAICTEAMAKAQVTYDKLLVAGVPDYKASIVFDFARLWCRLAKLENTPSKPSDNFLYTQGMSGLRIQARQVRHSIL